MVWYHQRFLGLCVCVLCVCSRVYTYVWTFMCVYVHVCM